MGQERSRGWKRTEKELFARTSIHKFFVWHAENLHYARQLLLLILAGEDGETRVQLGKDAPKTPHVDGHMIVHAEDDFW